MLIAPGAVRQELGHYPKEPFASSFLRPSRSQFATKYEYSASEATADRNV